MLFYIITAVLIGNIISVLGATLLLKLKNELLTKLTREVNAFAGGILLGAAFIGMLPKAIEQAGSFVSYFVLAGILFFFLLEKLMLWRFCADEHCDRHNKAGALMLMAGDSFHNLLDGIVIAAAFLQSISFGFVVAISVFAHELPQEIADFGVMIRAGISKRKAIIINIASGLTAIIGAVFAWYFAVQTKIALPYILAFSASGFIYISLADLIPQLHKKYDFRESTKQFLLILSGLLVIFISVYQKP